MNWQHPLNFVYPSILRVPLAKSKCDCGINTNHKEDRSHLEDAYIDYRVTIFFFTFYAVSSTYFMGDL